MKDIMVNVIANLIKTKIEKESGHFNIYICMRTIHHIMSSAYTTNLRSVSIFDLSRDELRERLRPTAEAVKQEKFAKGGYITYYDPLVCPTTAHAVYEFRDRKELMRVDKVGKIHFVKIL